METMCIAILFMVMFSTRIVTLSAQGASSISCQENIHRLCGDSGETSYLPSCLLAQTRNTGNNAEYSSTSPSGSKIKIIIGIVVGVVLVICLIVGVIIFIRKRKPKLIVAETRDVKDVEKGSDVETNVQDGSNKGRLVTPESLQYELKDLQIATNNFSRENKIGRGGFGIVYKGTLPNGQEIAVKRLSNGSGQGDKEFQNEIALLAQLQHRNLVKLLGYCLVDDEALLVYEFLENKSLDYFIFDRKKQAELNWSRRFEIIKGVARGMMYIHDDCPVRMMHRDLKAANVLLDSEMYPKIADFGLARICDVGQTHINPTRVVGTHGYMAPEYIYHGQFSAKSDVYALGVLILEIVSGRRTSDSSIKQQGRESLLSHAWRSWEDKKYMEIMDSTLKDSYLYDEVLKCVQLGLLCVQEDSNLRPTMSNLVHMLNSYTDVASLPVPQHPAFIYSGGSNQPLTSSSKGDTTGSLA
ncbi:putative cysteine-rich receptor-like protein kinase 20 [Silene latifolia]|uniref:putative cysteine-rich receptor-like protein kinase 20 n=1 Tax=Silene latifolia TaxID=37657 RepID=UPI003D78639B